MWSDPSAMVRCEALNEGASVARIWLTSVWPLSAISCAEITSTGTAVETPVPVDVISAQEIADNGQTEVNQILATLAPSFNASHLTIADGSDHINPASLRGLGPDQVLVLVNGKRRHASALVHVNGTF